MNIIAGIDGTHPDLFPGDDRNRRYDQAFQNSFVTRIARRGGNTSYWRGPVLLGGGLVPAINGAVSHIERLVRTTRGVTNVLLTGYSRGAAGIVVVAKELADRGINVRAMLLFDAVDRQLFVDADVIPNNVGHVMHVVRDSRGSSRESFDNDGLRSRPPTRVEAFKFMCTHGGMGGCPAEMPRGGRTTDRIDEGGYDGMTTITYQQDARVSEQVWRHVQPFISTYGFMR